MDRHIEWYDMLKRDGTRMYCPIPEAIKLDPVIKTYETGGSEGHLYVTRTPTFAGFKVGSTTQLVPRMYYYPQGTELLYCVKVDANLRQLEKEWITHLRRDDRVRLGRKREWFRGNHQVAIEVLHDMLRSHTGSHQTPTNSG